MKGKGVRLKVGTPKSHKFIPLRGIIASNSACAWYHNSTSADTSLTWSNLSSMTSIRHGVEVDKDEMLPILSTLPSLLDYAKNS